MLKSTEADLKDRLSPQDEDEVQVVAATPITSQIFKSIFSVYQNAKDGISNAMTKENLNEVKDIFTESLAYAKDGLASVANKESMTNAKNTITESFGTVKEAIVEVATKENLDATKTKIAESYETLKETVGGVINRESLNGVVETVKETFTKENIQNATEVVAQSFATVKDTITLATTKEPKQDSETVADVINEAIDDGFGHVAEAMTPVSPNNLTIDTDRQFKDDYSNFTLVDLDSPVDEDLSDEINIVAPGVKQELITDVQLL
jgi:hypothetical protein